MAGYTYKWRCRICDELQDTIDSPRPQVCEKCIQPVADKLCRDEIHRPLNTRGVDKDYWMGEARFLAALFVKRWSPLQQRDARIPPHFGEVLKIGVE